MPAETRLTLVKSDCIEDWYLIERAEHDGREWFEQTGPNTFALRMSARLGNADIEGSAAEMRAIAKAIREHDYTSFRRCAVDARSTKKPTRFWSPRNSIGRGEVPYADALALAEEIDRALGVADAR